MMLAAYYTTGATNRGLLVLTLLVGLVVLWRSRSYQTPRELAVARRGLEARYAAEAEALRSVQARVLAELGVDVEAAEDEWLEAGE